MRVLALDIATNCGVAIVSPDGVELATSWALLDGVRTTGRHAPPLDTRHVMAVQSLRNRMRRVIEIYRPDVVAIEREWGRGTGGRFLVALYTAANEGAFVASLPSMGIRIGDWRKHIHGTAGWSSARFKDAALALVPEAGKDKDAAEAALIGRYVVETARIDGRAAA